MDENDHSGMTYRSLVERLQELGIKEPWKSFRKLRRHCSGRSRNECVYRVSLRDGFGSLGDTTFGEIYRYYLHEKKICIGSFYIHGDGRTKCYDR